MEGYLGESPVKIEDSPYKDYTPADWAMHLIERYGGIDGAHHKDWVMDQVARVLKGTPMEIVLAKWSNGQEEYRINTVEPPSQEYNDWVIEMLGEYDENEGYEYGYETGIAP